MPQARNQESHVAFRVMIALRLGPGLGNLVEWGRGQLLTVTNLRLWCNPGCLMEQIVMQCCSTSQNQRRWSRQTVTGLRLRLPVPQCSRQELDILSPGFSNLVQWSRGQLLTITNLRLMEWCRALDRSYCHAVLLETQNQLCCCGGR